MCYVQTPPLKRSDENQASQAGTTNVTMQQEYISRRGYLHIMSQHLFRLLVPQLSTTKT